jgi:hypothetical protein
MRAADPDNPSDRLESTASRQVGRPRLGRFLRGVVLGWLLPLAVALVVIQLFVYRETSVPGFASRPASGLQDLSTEADLQARFAQDIGHPRLLLLVSPT